MTEGYGMQLDYMTETMMRKIRKPDTLKNQDAGLKDYFLKIYWQKPT